MPVQTKSLGASDPATPICQTLNNYCGVTLAQAIEATADDAATNARDKAKSVAQDALDRAALRNCPAVCGAGSTPNSGYTVPRLKEFGPFEDPRAGKFVAYAVAYWEREANCGGNAGQQIALDAGSWTEEFHYSPGDPECDKKNLYAGCVISKTVDKVLTDAKRKADAKALSVANGFQTDDRAKGCPGNCQPGELDPPDPPPALTAVRLFQPHLFQMKTKPYAAFAVTHFQFTITCPKPVVEEEEEEDEEEGGGGSEFMERKPTPRRPKR